MLQEPSDLADFMLCFLPGVAGFNELLKLNPRFQQYSHLFNKESKNSQRFLADAQTNKALDEAIEEFLLLLSPYLLTLKPAIKAMEWLLQRYAIHEMNVDAVMMCILPFYESPLFLRVLKVLDLQRVGSAGEVNKWQWLTNAQKSGVLLVRSILADQWMHSSSFRAFCNIYIKKVIDIHEVESDAQPTIHFFVTTVVGGVARMSNIAKNTGKSQVTDDHIMRVVKSLKVLMKSNYTELVCGGYLIIMQLAISVKLEAHVWHKVVTLLIKYAQDDLKEQLCACLVTIYHQQSITHVDADVLDVIQDSFVLSELVKTPEQPRVASFLLAYAGGYVRSALTVYDGNDEDLKEQLFSIAKYISKYNLSASEVAAIIRNMMESIAEFASSLSVEVLQKCLSQMLELLESSFPDGFDKSVNFFQHAVNSPSGETYSQILVFMNQVSSKKLAEDLAEAMEIAQEELPTALSSVKAMLALQAKISTAELRKANAQHTKTQVHSLADECITAVLTYKVERHPPKNATLQEKTCLKLAATGVIPWDLIISVVKTCMTSLTPLSANVSYTLPATFKMEVSPLTNS